MTNLHIVLVHPVDQIIRNIADGVRTRSQSTNNFCLYVNFVSLIEPKMVNGALKDVDCIS